MQGGYGQVWGLLRGAPVGPSGGSELAGRIAILQPIEASRRQRTIREKHWVPSTRAATETHDCRPNLYNGAWVLRKRRTRKRSWD